MRKVHVRHALAAVRNDATVRQVNDSKMWTKVLKIDGANAIEDKVF